MARTRFTRSLMTMITLPLLALIGGLTHGQGINLDYTLRPADVIAAPGQVVDVPVFFDNDAGGVQGFDFHVCNLPGEVNPLTVVPGGRLNTLVVDFFQATVAADGFDVEVVLDSMSWIPLGPGHEIVTVTYDVVGNSGTLLGSCSSTPQITAFSSPVTPVFEVGSILIDNPFDATNHHVIFAGESYGGAINSVESLRLALEANGQQVAVVTELDAGIFSNPKAIWACCGTYPYNHVLSAADGAFLALSVQSGTPVYVEGNDIWGFDPQTTFADYDGVLGSAVLDGDDSFTGMIGITYGSAEFNGFDSPYNQDNPTGSDYTDQLVSTMSDASGPNANVVWINDNPLTPYGTGVMYDTSSSHGDVLVQSWEFGGYGYSQNVLAQKYLIALGFGVSGQAFGRGDANADGTLNIADAGALLGVLFSGDPSLSCEDAGDVNDDGTINVADAVYMLTFLFGGGTPPPAPGCGIDPTVDFLGCDSGTPCLI